MKSKSLLPQFRIFATATLVTASSAYAAPVIKHTAGTNLALAASWSSGLGPAPTSTDAATWNGTSLGGALTVGSVVSWGSIDITGATANIATTGSAITTGDITLAGNRTLSIANAIALSGNSIYTIADVTSSTATDATLGAISGASRGITKEGAGTLVLSAVSNYTGNTTVNAGTLELGSAGSIYAAGSTETITVASDAHLKLSRAVNNALGSGVGQIWNISGTLTQATAFAQIMAGSVTLNGGTLTSTAGNTTYGSFTVLGYDSTITANGTGNTISSVNLGIGGGLTLNLATTLSTDTLLASTIIKDANTAGGKLTKSGAGTVTLTGANTYTGATSVSGGKLLVNGTHIKTTGTAATTGYTVTGAGSTLGGTGRIAINANVSVGTGALLAPGASIGTLTLDGANRTGDVLTMTTGAEFAYELAGDGSTADQVSFWNYTGGDLVLNGNEINLDLLGTLAPGTYNLDIFKFFSNAGTTATTHAFVTGLTIGSLDSNISAASIDWNGTGDNNNAIAVNFTVIPEPAAALLGSLGMLALLRRRRA